MNESNLIPLSQRTKSERREIATQGGIASGHSRRERKKMREYLEAAMVMETEYRGEVMSNAEAVTAALVSRAKRGDVRAYQTIRDGLGEKPVEKVVTNELTPEEFERAKAEIDRILFGEDE